MYKKGKIIISVILIFILSFTFIGCDILSNNDIEHMGGNEYNEPGNNGGKVPSGNEDDDPSYDDNEVKEVEVDEEKHDYELVDSGDGVYTYTDSETNESKTMYITLSSGSSNGYKIEGNTITFSGIIEDTVYSLKGEFYGNIVVSIDEAYKLEIELNGFSITSYVNPPINIQSGDKVELSAKKGTKNYVYDLRDEVSEEGISAPIYSLIDLEIKGKGELYVVSTNNNGIHSKDDLEIKNLTLQVECEDNALKGNDGVEILSGNITLISRTGDGIKTSNSHISSKGNQKGNISILGGNILIYSACDGIDAAHSVLIEESNASISMEIYTDKYSKYSKEVTANTSETLYVRMESTTYKYSIKYYNSDTDYKWVNSSTYKTVSGGMRNYYYYPMTKESNYTKIQLFIYSQNQQQGQEESYVAKSDYITLNSMYDTIAISNRNGQLTLSWTNYTTSFQGGMPGGFGGGMPGGMFDGNKDKGEYSTKGIKSDNEIVINSGNIFIQSYDDSIHANNDVVLGDEDDTTDDHYGSGNVTITGGIFTINSNDDGLHADGTLEISGGKISINKSYEGLEGNVVHILGGEIDVISSDDGINSVTTTGEGIVFRGGTTYIQTTGDGIDSNSTTSYSGIVFDGGNVVVISSSGGNSTIDTERGYRYTSGKVVAIGISSGMVNESKNCSNFSSVATTTNISVTNGNYLTVSDFCVVKLPVTMSATIIVLGNNSAKISQSSSTDYTINGNVYWMS